MALETWRLDGTRSGIRFSVRHLLFAKISGRFAQWSGSVRAAEGEIDFTSLELLVDTASLDTGLARRDVYLRSSHFLNVAAYPSLVFAGRRVEKGRAGQVRILGALTIRGATRDAVFDVEDCVRSRDRQGRGHTSFAMKSGVDRRDFGLTWSGAHDSRATLLSDHVDIEVEVLAARMAHAESHGKTSDVHVPAITPSGV
jgi:polyisoprenoid-binding protein YceI